jgi:glutamate decarboxylase
MPSVPPIASLKGSTDEGAPMTLTHPNGPTTQTRDLSILPIFELEGCGGIPRHEMPAGDMPADVAYQIVHDELMLDGNARMNLATFVTT